MNDTERKAYNWLESEGHSGIIFSINRSPDFVTKDGATFEAKKLRSNTIYFSLGQWRKLETIPNTKILVFNSKSEPVAIIPFTEIQDGRLFWNNIRIVKGKGDSAIQFYLDTELHADLHKHAKLSGLTLREYILKILQKAIDTETVYR